MSAPKFTPGPWKYIGMGRGGTVEGSDEAIVVDSGDWGGLIEEADGRLIAAAPDFYRSATDAVARIKQALLAPCAAYVRPCLEMAVRDLTDALAKAEGKS